MEARRNEMPDELRQIIYETYDGGCWEPASSKLFDNDGTPTQVWVFEDDVEWAGQAWRCLIVTLVTYDTDEVFDVVDSEDLLATAWPLDLTD